MPTTPPKTTGAPHLTKPELLSILSHPTRVHCIGVLSERSASVKELAAELRVDDQNVRYHINQLKKVGLIKLAREDRDREDGRVVERFYQATKRAWFDRATWEQIPTPNGATAAIMGLINEDIAQAITAGTFDKGHNHISRTPIVLDRESYEEMLSLLAETLERIFAIKTLALDRMESDIERISTVVNIIQFDLPSRT